MEKSVGAICFHNTYKQPTFFLVLQFFVASHHRHHTFVVSVSVSFSIVIVFDVVNSVVVVADVILYPYECK